MSILSNRPLQRYGHTKGMAQIGELGVLLSGPSAGSLEWVGEPERNKGVGNLLRYLCSTSRPPIQRAKEPMAYGRSKKRTGF
jgi:hypothetical protein